MGRKSKGRRAAKVRVAIQKAATPTAFKVLGGTYPTEPIYESASDWDDEESSGAATSDDEVEVGVLSDDQDDDSDDTMRSGR
jgi:hypothetical protein